MPSPCPAPGGDSTGECWAHRSMGTHVLSPPASPPLDGAKPSGRVSPPDGRVSPSDGHLGLYRVQTHPGEEAEEAGGSGWTVLFQILDIAGEVSGHVFDAV